MSILGRIFARRNIGGLVLVWVLGTSGRLEADTLAVDAGAAPMMQFSTALTAAIQQMLEASPTFRLQYQRILDSAKVVLVARLDPALTSRTFRARSSIRRYKSGLLIVWMDIAPGVDEARWIAHEFEHVVEQLDGQDLKRLAIGRAPGIWYSTSDMIETDRALRAGNVVFDEIRGKRGRPDKFVH